MTENIIIERTLQGGLTSGIQRYRIRYMPEEPYIDKVTNEEKIYSPKMIIEHRIEDIEKRFWSLRFSTDKQLLDFIGHCIEAYIFFRKKLGGTQLSYEIMTMRDYLNEYIKKGVERGVNQ